MPTAENTVTEEAKILRQEVGSSMSGSADCRENTVKEANDTAAAGEELHEL